MDAATTFQDLGVNAIRGTHILDLLGLNMEELQIPSRLYKLQGVVKYLNQFPEDTQRFLVNKAVRSKMVNKLDHMFEYVDLLRRKEGYEEGIRAVEKEKSAVGESDIAKAFELQSREDFMRSGLSSLQEEIAIYEK